MNQLLDYRNGKYQGGMDKNRQRHGLGIFIDDDLTFYLSDWRHSQLNGPTLLYLAHGKYLYGQTRSNQPHGLNVFRSGDTVLLAYFKEGRPTEKALIIFQKYNFACVLEEADDKEWQVAHHGKIVTHNSLLEFVKLSGLNVPDHYYSLTKFACSFARQSQHIKTFPCHSHCCYLGFARGLAIVFNSNNGLVSVGSHANEEVVELGGKFWGSRSAEEGNFEMSGERIKYNGTRPTTQLHAIFQKVHKRSMNFINEYFDSKIGNFMRVEGLLRSQLKELTQMCQQQVQRGKVDLNDSLDYHQLDEQESIQRQHLRDAMYSPPKKYLHRDCYSPLQSQIQNKSPSSFTPSRIEATIGKKQRSSIGKAYLVPSEAKECSEVHYEYDRSRSRKYSNSHTQSQSTSQLKQKRSSCHRIGEVSSYQISSKSRHKESVTMIEQDRKCHVEKTVGRTQRAAQVPVPTFSNRGGMERHEGKKQAFKQFVKQIKQGKAHSRPNIFDEIEVDIPARKKSKYEQLNFPKPMLQQPQEKRYSPKEETQSLSPVKPRRSIDVKKLQKPTYEDIEERRQRISRQMQNIVPPSSGPTSCDEATPMSTQREPQDLMPLTISHKPNAPAVTSYHEKSNRERQSKLSGQQQNLMRKGEGEGVSSEVRGIISRINGISRLGQQTDVQQSQSEPSPKFKEVKGVSPVRQRRNYQYLIDG